MTIAANAFTDHTPYTDNAEHLRDALARIATLYHAQTVRWRHEIAAHKPPHLWGMIQISDAEIEAMLTTPFEGPGAVPQDLRAHLEPHWQAASRQNDRIEARAAATPQATDLRLRRLAEALDLSDLDRDALLVCLLPELDIRYRRLVGYLLDDATRTRPSLDLVVQILHPLLADLTAGRSLFLAESPLLARHILRLGGSGEPGDAHAEGALMVDPRIAGFLLGDDAPDRRVRPLIDQDTAPPPLDRLVLEEDRRKQAEELPTWLTKRRADGAGALIYLRGAEGAGRKAYAAAVANLLQRPLTIIPASRLAQAGDQWELLIDLAFREAALNGGDIVWCGVDTLRGSAETGDEGDRWKKLVEAALLQKCTTWFTGERTWYASGAALSGRFLHIDLPPPSTAQRIDLWDKRLPPADAFGHTPPDREKLIRLLVGGFRLNAGQIDNAVKLAQSFAIRRQPMNPALEVEDLCEACRRQSGAGLARLARRIEPLGDLSFDDLTLQDDSRRQIDDLRNRIRLRTSVFGGLGFRRNSAGGFVALFTGDSGTGKTMAAQLLAQEQGVDLYKVDLSQIVSKYVGETEKNLERIFTEAEDANAILFFDEADSLFGKRGDVKEAKDRWANLEVNYLLQRVEEFSGVVILATNLRQNIDAAFLRRIHTIVEFPFPDAAARARIWAGMFPGGVQRPKDEVIETLAERFELSGGAIRNVTVDAAFRALADADAAQTMPEITERHLIVSLCREYLKVGKPVTPAEFGARYYDIVAQEIL